MTTSAEALRLDEFAGNLHQEVLAKAGMRSEEPGTGPQPLREEMFTETILELLDDHGDVDGWELCGYESRSIGSLPAAKLSAWSLSADGATLDLFVTLYGGTGRAYEIGIPEVRRQFELLLGFLKRALGGFHTKMEEASLAFHAAASIYAARESLATVRLFFLSDCVARSLEVGQGSIPGINIEYVAWDLDKLSRLRAGDRSIIEIDIERNYGGSIPCLESSIGAGEYRTFLAFVRAPVLAQMYGEYGQRLLERNVRAFLQTKGKINKGLQTTLKEEPDRFLAYNNGLCCTASEVRVDVSRHGELRLQWVKDFQIVNGGQTTASLFHAVKKEKLDLSQVLVQVKLTVIDNPDHVAEIVPMISRYANSQNKVNTADFSANGAFHRSLERLSRSVWAPAVSGMERATHWYYERARGSYLDDKTRQGTPARQKEWARQNPPAQRFAKTDLAKYEHAWLGMPHMVCRGAEKNFLLFAERLQQYGEPVVDEQFFQRAIGKVTMWRGAEDLFDELDLVGYRANSVAYAMSFLAEFSHRRIDLDQIWRAQRLSPELSDALRAACAAAHRFLLGLPGNIGEASKRPETWAAFRTWKFDLPVDWWNGLTSSDGQRDRAERKPKRGT